MSTRESRRQSQAAAPSSNQAQGQVKDAPPDLETLGVILVYFLMVTTSVLIILTFPFSLLFTLKIVKDYERIVIFRIGGLVFGGARRVGTWKYILTARGPGLVVVAPCIDTYRKTDLRQFSYAMPSQETQSNDTLEVNDNDIVYLRKYFGRSRSTRSSRNAIGTRTLTEPLSEQEASPQLCVTILDEGDWYWSVKVEGVEVSDVRVPKHLVRDESETQAPKDDDEEGQFGKTVAAFLRTLPPMDRIAAKTRIEELMHDVRFDSGHFSAIGATTNDASGSVSLRRPNMEDMPQEIPEYNEDL